MKLEERPDLIHNTIAVAPAADGVYVLTTVYPESDALNASGQLLHNGNGEETETRCILNTTSPLAVMWCSPAGNLWIGSADGTVWTTAAVNWPAPNGIDFDVLDPALPWSVTRLPALAKQDFAPNVTAIWGASDQNVFCATFSGSIYQWNGTEWCEASSGFESSLTCLNGTGPADVYCTGYSGALSHFNGTVWTPVGVTGISPASTIVMGVRALTPERALAVTNRGTLLEGNSNGFKPLASAKAKFTGIAALADQIILSSSPGGAWQLKDAELVSVKSNFAATAISEFADRLYFIETEQPSGPSAIVYNPQRLEGSPWQRIIY